MAFPIAAVCSPGRSYREDEPVAWPVQTRRRCRCNRRPRPLVVAGRCSRAARLRISPFLAQGQFVGMLAQDADRAAALSTTSSRATTRTWSWITAAPPGLNWPCNWFRPARYDRPGRRARRRLEKPSTWLRWWWTKSAWSAADAAPSAKPCTAPVAEKADRRGQPNSRRLRLSQGVEAMKLAGRPGQGAC